MLHRKKKKKKNIYRVKNIRLKERSASEGGFSKKPVHKREFSTGTGSYSGLGASSVG